MEYGYVIISKKLLQWRWADNPNVGWTLIHLVLKASYESKEWHDIKVGKGQVVISVSAFADEVGISRQQMRTALQKLEESNTIVTKSTNKYTLVTICNFESYQDFNKNNQPTNNHQITNKQPSNNHQITTSNTINTIKTLSYGESKNAPTHAHGELPAFRHYENRSEYIRAMLDDKDHWKRFNANDSFWLDKGLTPMLLSKAFLQYLTTEKPNNTWSNLQDFESHFSNWMKYQQWDDIVELTGKYDAAMRDKKYREQREQEQAQAEAEWEEHKKRSCPMPANMAARLLNNN